MGRYESLVDEAKTTALIDLDDTDEDGAVFLSDANGVEARCRVRCGEFSFVLVNRSPSTISEVCFAVRREHGAAEALAEISEATLHAGSSTQPLAASAAGCKVLHYRMSFRRPMRADECGQGGVAATFEGAIKSDDFSV